jgi:hypothetical protein
MDVICEAAAAAVAARVEGAYPREVWLAAIQKVFDCGFKANEQLEGITSEQVLVVVQALSDSGIPVGHLFVRKVINAYIDRRRVPFGPRKASKGGEGPGSRTLTGDDVRWIVDLLAWNGACGVSLSIIDICQAAPRLAALLFLLFLVDAFVGCGLRPHLAHGGQVTLQFLRLGHRVLERLLRHGELVAELHLTGLKALDLLLLLRRRPGVCVRAA